MLEVAPCELQVSILTSAKMMRASALTGLRKFEFSSTQLTALYQQERVSPQICAVFAWVSIQLHYPLSHLERC